MSRYGARWPRPIVGMAALGLAVTAAGLSGSWGVHAQQGCGATASDLFGTFVAHQTSSAGAAGQGYDGQATVTLSAPNNVATDEEVTRNGQTLMSMKGSGTFSLQPLTWTERGTASIGGRTGPFELTFTASKIDCASSGQVSDFNGTYSSPSTTRTVAASFVRRS